jgi:hypothetical protein
MLRATEPVPRGLPEDKAAKSGISYYEEITTMEAWHDAVPTHLDLYPFLPAPPDCETVAARP